MGGPNGWGPGVPPRLECVTAVGFAEDANPRHRPTMEDAHVVLDEYLGDRGTGFFGIYDGHGGRAAVDVIATILHQLFEEELGVGRRDAAAAAAAAASAEAVARGATEEEAAAAAAAAEAAALTPNDSPADPSAGVIVSIGVGGVEVLGGGRGALAADAPRAMAAAYRRADDALADGKCQMAGTTAVTMFLHEVDELLPLDGTEGGGAAPAAAAALPPTAASSSSAVAPPAPAGEGVPVVAAPPAARVNGDAPPVLADRATPAGDTPPAATQAPLDAAPPTVAASPTPRRDGTPLPVDAADVPAPTADALAASASAGPQPGATAPGTPPSGAPVEDGAAVESAGRTAADEGADEGKAGEHRSCTPFFFL